MAYKFKKYPLTVLALTCICLAQLYDEPSLGYGDILEEMCRPDSESGFELKPLVEEAEATGMPTSTLKRLLVKGYQDHASSRELGRLLCIIVQAEEDGLPPELLFAKLDEGLGKRAPLSRIASVIEHKVDDMKYARRLLSGSEEPKMEDNNVTRVATVMAAGLPESKLDTIFSKYADVPVDMRVVAVEITAYGGIIGYDAQLLDQIVRTGLTSQAFFREWAFLVKVISKAKKKNISDQRITTEAVRTLSRKGRLNDLITALGMKPGDVY